MLVIGIDVGIGGGLAALSEKVAAATQMPIFKGDESASKIDIVGVKKWINDMYQAHTLAGGLPCTPTVVIEIQQAMPKQGVTSMFHLGESFGLLQGVPLIMGWPLRLVRPKSWKNVVLEGTLKDKTAAIEYVRAKYPQIDINVGVRKIIYHDGMADAVCIADYVYTHKK